MSCAIVGIHYTYHPFYGRIYQCRNIIYSDIPACYNNVFAK